MGKIDPFSEEELWERLEPTKCCLSVPTTNDNVLNSPGDGEADYLRIVCISDTHDNLHQLLPDIPKGDVLIHAGDFTNAGERNCLIAFNEDMGRLPHRYKLVVAGNHELGFDDNEDWSKRDPMWTGLGTPKGYELLTNVTYLQDQAITIEGVNFYGSSWHPLAGYPFTLERGPAMEEVWKKIPDNTDVLITHTPPLGYLDSFNNERWGCRHLLAEVEKKKPKFHIFGHVHECFGACTNDKTVFVNAAMCDKQNKLTNKPLVFYVAKP